MRAFVVSTFTLLLLTSVAFPQRASREPGENANTWVEKQDATAARAAEERKKSRLVASGFLAALVGIATK